MMRVKFKYQSNSQFTQRPPPAVHMLFGTSEIIPKLLPRDRPGVRVIHSTNKQQ